LRQNHRRHNKQRGETGKDDAKWSWFHVHVSERQKLKQKL